MNRFRLFALLTLMGVMTGSLLAHAQQTPAQYTQVVRLAASTLTLTADPNPSNVGDGTPAVLQVSSVPGALAPTGLVTFSAAQAGSITTGQVVDTASFNLDSTGKASWAFNLPPGTYQLTAAYAGNTDYAPGQAIISHTVIGPADFSLVLDPGSLIVKQGNTWTGSLTATSINNFQGVVKLSCDGGGPLVFMTCLPGQPLLVTAAAPTKFPIQVTSSATTLKIVGSGGLLLFGLGLFSKKRRRKQHMYAFALLSLLLLVTGCAGMRYEQRDGTPKGDYKMTFVGQSGSLSHAVSLVVTVQ